MCFSTRCIYAGLFILIVISPVFAFDDDSRDDTRSQSLNTFCENNQTLNDTPTLKSSCQGYIVNLQNRNTTLLKNGRAIYVNSRGLLYVDQIPMSPHTAKVLEFKVDSQATVFYLDNLGRLYKTKMVRKPARVKSFKLNVRGQLAYLTDGASRNLYFEDRNLSAGSHQIKDFSFTGTGEVVYRDAIGRLWKMGQLISD